MRRLIIALIACLFLSTETKADELHVSGASSDNVIRYDADSGLLDQELIGGAGLSGGGAMVFGPFGDLYVASYNTDEILKFDGSTGAPMGVFVAAGSGGLDGPLDIEYGHDGSLLVLSGATKSVLKYDGTTGVFIAPFVADDPSTVGIDETGGLVTVSRMALGVDGHLYIADPTRSCIHRYDGETGLSLGPFVTQGVSGLVTPTHFVFGPLGGLFVVSSGSGEILKFDEFTGAFEGVFVSAASGGLSAPTGIAFAPDNHFYVASSGTDEVLRFHGQSGAFIGVVVSAGDGGLDHPEDLLFNPMRRIRVRGPVTDIGAVSDLFVYGASPGGLMGLFVGFVPFQFPVLHCGYSLEVAPIILLSILNALGDGTASVPISYPAFASGFSILWQVIEPVSCRSSRVLRSTVGDSQSAATFILRPNGNISNSSTFRFGSFSLMNRSLNGQKISSVRIDLSTAFFMDMIYDPDGSGGDVVGKDLDIDTQSGDGVGFVSHVLNKPEDNGFSQMVIYFDDFEVGETVTFSIDVDPSTIQGSAQPGPEDSGSVSGLELCGSTVEILFDDGSSKVGTLYRMAGSDTGSDYEFEGNLPRPPSIELLGLNPPVITDVENQVVRVTGQIGMDVKLLRVESGLYLAGVPGGGFDVEPFESNKALNLTEYVGVIGTEGYVDIPVTLRQNSGLETGYNLFIATQLNGAGRHGPASNSFVVKYEP